MYITHALLSDSDWDVLAEAANWARRNQAILADTHWVGGDPSKLEVYGWASWTPAKGILTLRNPSERPQTVRIDVGETFELPQSRSRKFTARSPWKADANTAAISLVVGKPHTFSLQPFAVVTLETDPVR